MLKEDIISWSSVVDALDKEVNNFIKDNPLPKIPDFEEITSRKVLYTAYSYIIELSNKIAMLSNRIINMSMTKSQFKRLVRSEGYGPSVTTSLNNIIEEISERVNIIDKQLSTYKVAVDNQIRFYQSVQYILASPRLNAME